MQYELSCALVAGKLHGVVAAKRSDHASANAVGITAGSLPLLQ